MRVKEHQQKKQEKLFEQELSFGECLDSFSKPTSKELNEMEQEFIIKKKTHYEALNNTYYFPLQGA